MILETRRLRLRDWRETDRAALAAMHADAEVMADYRRIFTRPESDVRLDRYAASFRRHGLGRWALETLAGDFLGYVGIMPSWPEHPLAPHTEIGWRLVRQAWGHGYATEAARAALADAFGRVGLHEVLAYTAPDNLRSQAVMARLQLRRDPERDFTARLDGIDYPSLVWVAAQ